MLRLRLLEEGMSADELIRRFGGQSSGPVLKRLDRLVAQGLIIKKDSEYRLPSEQVLTSNPVFARVLGD
jgi:predicted transcriptional regulator